MRRLALLLSEFLLVPALHGAEGRALSLRQVPEVVRQVAAKALPEARKLRYRLTELGTCQAEAEGAGQRRAVELRADGTVARVTERAGIGATMEPALLATVASLSLAAAAWPAENGKRWEELEGCRRVAAEWADGDSFPVRTAGGERLTVRLYGVDCFEWHVNDETDARRLRDQRRYFGITGLDGGPEASIAAAKDLGRQAAERAAELLESPFTVRTFREDARGDGKHPRVYGFVRTADGRDLAAELVKAGLARAFGVCRDAPGGQAAEDYRDSLRDLELQAAKRGAGAWAKTDWEKLPAERQAQRDEEAEWKTAVGKGGVPAGFLLDPNSAARDELMRLPGVGEKTADRIIEGRPYRKWEDLDRVPGLGPRMLERLRPFLRLAPP